MFLLKKLIAGLALPPTSLIMLGFFGLWLARRHPRAGHGLAALALILFTALSLPPIAQSLIVTLEHYPPIPLEQLGQAQAIVILGGGSYRNAPEIWRCNYFRK